jgi:prevent-host-death family protein
MKTPQQARKIARHASIASLKARLSEYLKAVKAGEEIIVTDRGRPVARITPMAGRAQWDARIEELVRAGLASPPIAPLPPDFWDMPRPADPEGRSLAALLEERAEGR